MTLINCPECDGKISSKAMACPHCGCPAMYTARYLAIKQEQARKQAEIGKEKKEEEKKREKDKMEAYKERVHLQEENDIKGDIRIFWIAIWAGLLLCVIGKVKLISNMLFWLGLLFYFYYGKKLDSVQKKESRTSIRMAKVALPFLIMVSVTSLNSPSSTRITTSTPEPPVQVYDGAVENNDLTGKQKDLYRKCYEKMAREQQAGGVDINKPVIQNVRKVTCRNAVTSTTDSGCYWIDTC